MRDAMIRNTRAAVALRLPRRHAATVRVDGEAGERDAYHDLAELARLLAGDGSPGRHRLALHHLLAAAGSSPAAAAAAVERFAVRHADAPQWRALAERWGRRWAPAGRRRCCWICCSAIPRRRSWCSSTIARR